MPEQPNSMKGLLAAGNIDLTKRPIVFNPDGTTSSVRSMSFGDEQGREILVPTIADDGHTMSNREAQSHYEQTGQHMGIFSNPNDADAYGQQVHENYINGTYGRKYSDAVRATQGVPPLATSRYSPDPATLGRAMQGLMRATGR